MTPTEKTNDLDVSIKVLSKIVGIRRLERDLKNMGLNPEMFKKRMGLLKENVENLYRQHSSELREAERIYLERLNLEYLNSSEDDRRYLHATIDELNFSTRTNNALKREGVEYVGQLVNLDKSYLLKFRNMGRVSIKELQTKLAENGLRLGMDVQYIPLTRV